MESNRLVNEKSPYLQQHAHNPVNWYPWGADAFDKARREDKPIFLSIGYSTCHWCHVMERESFEDNGIAEVLNRSYVPIKVDREERPDVDRIYMNFVQSSTGSGGWPMSVFLTPELKPFFGGTYFPPDDRYGRPGFKRILEYLAEAWKNDREKIEKSSNEVIQQLQQREETAPNYSRALDRSVLDAAFQYFRRTYDSAHGGFGDAPKFPRPVVLNFLFRYYHHTRNDEARDIAPGTLRAMASGGMYDHLAGGFHRYSVDSIWFVPHFEKMLYDQAQLAIAYLEAYQITHEPFYAAIARGVFEYVLRDMTHPDGGFYSAEDADSVIDPGNPKVKGEGAYYVWSWEEVESILGAPAAGIFAHHYGIDKKGNVHNDPHEEFVGKNILFAQYSVEQTSAMFKMPPDDVASILHQARKKMLAARANRVRPDLDDKILTSWNALMISAFAKGAQVMKDPTFRDAAFRAADFVRTHMYNAADSTLLRRFYRGDTGISGFLDDYAFYAQAMLDLYETDFNPDHLETAIAITRKMRELFEDRENGGFFTTATGDPSLVMRVKDDYDGAEPAGNSVALMNLLRLAEITNLAEFHDAVEKTLQSLGPRIAHQPVAVPYMAAAADFYLSKRRQVVLAGNPSSDTMRAFLRKLHSNYQPNTVILLVDGNDTRPRLERLIPALGAMKELDGRPTVYVCEDYACKLPTHDVSKLDELLQ